MDPIAVFLFLLAAAKGAGTGTTPAPAVASLPAYTIPFYAMLVVQLSDTNKLVLMDKVNTGFVTDGTKVLVLRYGAADKAQQGLTWLKDTSKPQGALTAQYYTALNATVVRGPGLATIVFDAQNIGTVDDTGKFLGKVFQGTTQTVSAVISKLIAAGADLSKMAGTTTVGRRHSLGEALSWLDGEHTRHAGPHVPAGYHRAHKVLHYYR